MKDNRFALAFLFFSLLSCVLALAVHLDAQFIARDPGPRGGKVDAGQPVRGLTAAQQRFFNNALSRFLEVDSVGGNLPEETGKGLGPGFNGNQCASCHAQPATGGSSPSRTAFPFLGPNPQIAVANLDGASNNIPFFIDRKSTRLKYSHLGISY